MKKVDEESEDNVLEVYQQLLMPRRIEHFNYPIPYGDMNADRHPRVLFIDQLTARLRARGE